MEPVVGRTPPANIREHVRDFADRIEDQDQLAAQLMSAAGRLGTIDRITESLQQTGYRQLARGLMYAIGTGGRNAALAMIKRAESEVADLPGEDIERLRFAMKSLFDLALIDASGDDESRA